MPSSAGRHNSTINTAAAAVVENGQLLVVAKHAVPRLFLHPGGKIEPGELSYHTVTRELREELGVTATVVEELGSVEIQSAIERSPLRLSLFLTLIEGNLEPRGEISSYRWVRPGERGILLASGVATFTLPLLVRRRLVWTLEDSRDR